MLLHQVPIPASAVLPTRLQRSARTSPLFLCREESRCCRTYYMSLIEVGSRPIFARKSFAFFNLAGRYFLFDVFDIFKRAVLIHCEYPCPFIAFNNIFLILPQIDRKSTRLNSSHL